MLFVVDIGNTNIVAGVYRGETLARSWRLTTHRHWTADEVGVLLRGFFQQENIVMEEIQGVCVSSVVPDLVPVFEDASQRLFGCAALVVTHLLDLGISVKTDVPGEVGADRLVNAAAGFAQWGGPLILLDLGTAMTVDAISKSGEYLGGAIAPGIQLSMEALVARTAKLPRVEIAKPASPIGANTTEAIRSGLYHGTLGQLGELIARIKDVLGQDAVVAATGGWSKWLPLADLGVLHRDPDLTLAGLRLIYQRNTSSFRKGEGA